MKDFLKKIKIEYLYGNIDKDEFQRKRKELEYIITLEKLPDKTGEKIGKEKKII